jgi:hypothetical protein
MFTALHCKLDVVASHASKLIDRINLSDNVLKGARGDLVALRSSRYTLLSICTFVLVKQVKPATGARGDLVALRSSRYTLLICFLVQKGACLLVQQCVLAGTNVQILTQRFVAATKSTCFTGATVRACWYNRTDTDAALRCSHRFQTVWENQTGSSLYLLLLVQKYKY